MSFEIRSVAQADLRRWMENIEVAFGEELTDASFEDFSRVLEPSRALGAYDGDDIVGGGAAFSFRLTVPGARQVAAAGVTAVGVMPTHRRQGILRALMRRQLDDVRANGEPLAILWASEGNIYQRFGYGLATLVTHTDIERERTAFRRDGPVAGRVRLVSRERAAQAFPPVYDSVRRVTPGFYERSAEWWATQVLADRPDLRRGRSQKFMALHEVDGRPLAYAIYRVKSEWGDGGSKSVLDLQEVMSAEPAGLHAIWRYIFGIDLIARVQHFGGPIDHPLLLLLAEPRRLRARISDALWLRIVDVPAALRGRRYASDGDVVVEVTDSFMPDVAGRWRLTVRDGQADVQPTDAPAELTLDITDLGAVYLGGFSLAQLAVAGRTTEHSAGARGRADVLFASAPAPWCPRVF